MWTFESVYHLISYELCFEKKNVRFHQLGPKKKKRKVIKRQDTGNQSFKEWHHNPGLGHSHQGHLNLAHSEAMTLLKHSC